MVLKFYLYGILLVGGAIFASNLHYSSNIKSDGVALQAAAERGLRYGVPWPMTVLDVHGKYTKGEDWMAVFKPVKP